MSHQNTSTLPTSQAASLLRSRKRAAKALPDPRDTWRRDDVDDDELQKSIGKFHAAGVITVVDHVDEGENEYNVYRTHDGAYQYAQELDVLYGTPCGHSGLRNLGDGEYTCLFEECDARFGRDTAEEVVEA